MTNNKTYKYDNCPFTPFGKMKRGWFLFYYILINILYIVPITATNIATNETAIYIIFPSIFCILMLLLSQIFIFKKRFLDINNDSKRAWLCAAIMMFIIIFLNATKQPTFIILIPIIVFLSSIGPYEENVFNKNKKIK